MHILKKNGIPLSMYVQAPFCFLKICCQTKISLFCNLLFSYFGVFHNIQYMQFLTRSHSICFRPSVQFQYNLGIVSNYGLKQNLIEENIYSTAATIPSDFFNFKFNNGSIINQNLGSCSNCQKNHCKFVQVCEGCWSFRGLELVLKMEEVSVGAAGSTSVVDLSGDSHLQVTWTLTQE